MGRFWEEFSVGEVLITGRRTIDGGDVSRFAGLTGDFNPLHVDAEFAKTTPFGERVAHGILTLAVSHGQQNLGGWFEGTTLALLRSRGAQLDVFEAAAAGDVDRVRALLDTDPSLRDAHARDGWTPLHLAGHFRQTATIELLLARGADVNAVSRNADANAPL